MTRGSKALWLIFILLAALAAIGCEVSREPLNLSNREIDWPQYRKQSSRIAFSPQQPAANPKRRWRYKLKVDKEGEAYVCGEYSTGLRGNGKVEQVLVEINGESGDSEAHQSPIAAGNYVVIIDDGKLVCFNATTGKKLWKVGFDGCPYYPKICGEVVTCAVQRGAPIHPRPPEDPGCSQIRGEILTPGSVVGLRLETGKKLWETLLPEKVDWYLLRDYCIRGLKIIVVTNSGSRIQIDIRTGKITGKQSGPRHMHFMGPPVMDGDKIYVALGEERWMTTSVYAIDLTDGSIKWSRQFDYAVVCACFHGKNLIIVPSLYQRYFYTDKEACISAGLDTDEVMRGLPDDRGPRGFTDLATIKKISNVDQIAISCLDADTGITKWEYRVDPYGTFSDTPLSVAVSPDTGQLVWVLGEIMCFNIETGELVWAKGFRPLLFGAPTISGGIVWVPSYGVTKRTALRGLQISTGEEVATIDTFSLSAICASESVFSFDTHLECYR